MIIFEKQNFKIVKIYKTENKINFIQNLPKIFFNKNKSILKKMKIIS